MAANIVPGITDKQFLELEIKKWLTSQERHRQIAGDAYYDGMQTILKRKRTVIGEGGELKEVDNLPNNRLIDNQYAKMVDQKANYLCGQPVTFDTKNAAYGEALAKVFGHKAQRTLRIVAEKALTGGKAWMFPYYTDEGTLAFAMLPAHEVRCRSGAILHTPILIAPCTFSPFTNMTKKATRALLKKWRFSTQAALSVLSGKMARLRLTTNAASGSYVTVVDPKTQKPRALNWARIPWFALRPTTGSSLLCRVRCLQDALNLMLSNFVNSMEEDVHNTVLVIHNYDGEDLGEFRRNLATYGAVKVRTTDGSDGAVDTLEIEVKAENYKAVMELLKKAIIENARGYDAKDDRLNGTPNQMNIRSMYSDIDLDANGMETEFQAAFEDLLFFRQCPPCQYRRGQL